MSDEPRCKWAGSDRPRILPERHAEDCGGECAGCLPCDRAHCRICGMAHAAGTCAECLALTRESLHDIARMCDALPEEVEHRGIDGEAMMLLGPAADPEARGHLEASVAAGRVSADYLDAADGELHPLFVLGSWDMLWRDALEHDDGDDRLTVPGAVRYLDTQLTYMAAYEHVPFEDFARDLRACRSHMERVLHDGEQVETSRVACIQCGGRLERVYKSNADHDGWRCQRARCREFHDHARYARALHQQLASDGAERWVRVAEAVGVIPRPEQTLRTWIRNGDVQSYRDEGTGQVYVWWPDVREKHIAAQSRSRRFPTG